MSFHRRFVFSYPDQPTKGIELNQQRERPFLLRNRGVYKDFWGDVKVFILGLEAARH
jgi:hypothetical protein